MKDLLIIIAKALVDEPDAVSVTETEDGSNVVLGLRVADGDMGKVIGKQGRIAKSIRTVMKAAASHENKKVIVEILQ
ncbi:MAG: KH domain-containing protein [Ruminococcaceae bacterium]|nr:KH domain-containing protein [Oscillospiraceae bacterium]MBE7039674.1 KH domain-containing protein [Oscillospiraceae bacterium]